MSASKVSAVVEGDGRFRRLFRYRWIIIAAVVILTAGLAITAWASYRATPHTRVVTQAQTEALARLASQYAYEKQYDKAFATYDQAISTAGSNDLKASLYVSKFNVAYNAKYYATAIDAGEKLVQLKQSGPYYGMLASAYEAQGNKRKALENYQKAVAFYKTGKHNSNAGLSQYEAKVAQLGGGSR